MNKDLYSFVVSKMKRENVSFSKRDSHAMEVFEDSILDFLSLEIYRKKEVTEVVNSFDYLCFALESIGYQEEEFGQLLIGVINSYNRFTDHPIYWYPLGKERRLSYEYGVLSFHSPNNQAKENLLFLLDQLNVLHQRRNVYEK